MKKQLLFLFVILLMTNIRAQEEPRFESYNLGQEFTAITVNKVTKTVWAGTNQAGVFSLDISDSNSIPTNFSIFDGSDPSSGPALNNIRIKSMAADGLGNVWIGHQGINYTGGVGGMERISSNLGIKHYSSETNYTYSGLAYNQRDGLATRRITSVCTDKYNTVWSAHKYTDLTVTGTNPIYILQPGAFSYKGLGSQNFTTVGGWHPGLQDGQPDELPYPAYTYDIPVSATPGSRIMDAIACDDTNMYVFVRGYYRRVSNTQTDGGYIPSRLLQYDLLSKTFQTQYFQSDIFPFSGGVINGICANNAKGIWVTNSVAGRGFSVYKNGTWSYLDPTNYGQIIPGGARFNPNAIWKDKIGRVFLGTDKGLIVYNGHGDVTDINSYKVYTKEDYGAAVGNEHNVHDPTMASSNILGGYADPHTNRSWIATDSGIMKLFLPPEGMVLYNVKDHFSYTSITPDADDKIILLTELKNEVTDGLAIDSEIPSIAADGSGSTLFRFKTEDPEGYYNIANPTYRLMVGPGPVSQIDTETYRKRYGQFTKKALESYEGNPTADQLEYVEFIYIHPEYIDANDYQANENYARFDFKIVNVSDSTNPIEFRHPVKIAVY